MNLETIRALAETLPVESYLGKVNSPVGFYIQKNPLCGKAPMHKDFKWQAICVFPDSERSLVFKTAKEARAWALEQKSYAPTIADVTLNGRFGCD